MDTAVRKSIVKILVSVCVAGGESRVVVRREGHEDLVRLDE